ncbi:MAG TPA: NAD(P)/FAD-dependent oxidoreductase [Flavitalea sp.]|nr:NAD(P)/FAD-dependent oxidoreductase [Flavitalea sp.]
METNTKLPNEQTVIVVGAGAAGLIAARQLADAGTRVILLEAASVPGGRMHTLREPGFSIPVEAGAEFIHGQLPITLGLLQEAGIEFTAIAGDMKTVRSGNWLAEDPMNKFWDELMQKMNETKEDLTVDAFLAKHFSDHTYATLRISVKRFAEGFDLADPARASTLALKQEWANEFEEEQYRIQGGYILLAEYLLECCRDSNVEIHFSSVVKEVSWGYDQVTVRTADSEFQGHKVLLTVSAGIMQSGQIRFTPEPSAVLQAYKDIGYGSVIKFLLEFSKAFWKNDLKDAGFVLSDEAIPTWWTQAPGDSTLLTGWLGGPSALRRSSMPEHELLDLALASLSAIFHLPASELKDILVKSRIVNWSKHPIALGGYSYSLPASDQAKKILAEPVEDTLFFAGEALYLGDAPGTVEAAFITGQEAAIRILGAKNGKQ